MNLIKQHGRFQVELKHHYPLNMDKNNQFSLDVYILSPFSLEILETTYKRPEILSDTHIYTRYTIYDTTLEELLSRENRRSPLVRLEDMLKGNPLDTSEEKRKVLYEFRVLANTFLDLMDERERYFKNLIFLKDPSQPIKERVIYFYGHMEEFLMRFRSLMTAGEGDVPYDNTIRQAYSLADEIISFSIENVLSPLLSLFNDADGATGKKRIRKLLERESEYRRVKEYAYIDGENASDNNKERVAFRVGILKKWAHSVNYLDKKTSSLNANTGHLLAAIAAAVAMSFAVLATLYANRFFVMYSLPWIGIAIFSYSLKDRIKEGLRAIFKRMIPLMISDRTDNLFDNLINRPVGRARLTVEYIRNKDLPGEILDVFKEKEDAFRSILPPENVLHISRKITIMGKKLRPHHERLNSITEVFRMNLFRFTRNMDDPEKILWYFNQNEPVPVEGSRVYRLRFAVGITAKNEKQKLSYYNVIMRQDGILRIDTIKAPD